MYVSRKWNLRPIGVVIGYWLSHYKCKGKGGRKTPDVLVSPLQIAWLCGRWHRRYRRNGYKRPRIQQIFTMLRWHLWRRFHFTHESRSRFIHCHKMCNNSHEMLPMLELNQMFRSFHDRLASLAVTCGDRETKEMTCALYLPYFTIVRCLPKSKLLKKSRYRGRPRPACWLAVQSALWFFWWTLVLPLAHCREHLFLCDSMDCRIAPEITSSH